MNLPMKICKKLHVFLLLTSQTNYSKRLQKELPLDVTDSASTLVIYVSCYVTAISVISKELIILKPYEIL